MIIFEGEFGQGQVVAEPAPLAKGVAYYTFKITQLNWPAEGDVLDVFTDLSSNNGKTWQRDGSWSYTGGPWLNKQRQPITEAIGGVHTNNLEPMPRLIRFTLNIKQFVGVKVELQ
jgi:hypothetical protein